MTDLGRVEPGATVDAVIVTHNSAHLINALLQTLLEAPGRNGRVIVSDSGSTDGTSEIVSGFPEAIFIANDNRGFGAACNVGARCGRSQYIAFINPDVLVTWPQLAQLAHTAMQLGASAIAPLLVDGYGRVSSAGSRSICPPWRRRGTVVRRPGHPYHVETATGACLVLQREMFDRLRGFDERYFLYAEEDDLLKRVRNEGGSVVVDPSVQVVHLGESSSTGVPEWWRSMHRMRSHRLYIAKHFSSAESLVDGLVSTVRILTSHPRTSRLKSIGGLWKP
jgi:N-acetylglucosaminyl-diphospho-decaprenol L-rhamnosyltransferase